jgi:glycyl-tRNA synthetase alpha chain
MYVQGVDNVYDLNFNGLEGDQKVTYGDVFLQAEQEYSRHNFEYANTEMLLRHFTDAENECGALLKSGFAGEGKLHLCVMPAYDQCIKASHMLNLLDARGAMSATDRQRYILSVRDLARQCGEAFMMTEAGGAKVAKAA